LYSECLTKEALEGFGDFKIGGQIIHIVKYAEDLVILAKEEKVLQDMIDKLTEIGRCYGMEMNVEKRKWKAIWIGHILRRNCLLQQGIEGKIKGRIEVT